MAESGVQDAFFSAANVTWAVIGVGIGLGLEAWFATPEGQAFIAKMAVGLGFIDPVSAAEGASELALSANDAEILGSPTMTVF